MKKLLALVLALALAFSLVACGASKEEKEAAASSSLAAESAAAAAAAKEELLANSTEGEFGIRIPNGTISISYQEYIPKFYKASGDAALAGMPWATAIDQQWKDWGYTDIVLKDGINTRTFVDGQYQSKYVKVINDGMAVLNAALPGMRDESGDGPAFSKLSTNVDKLERSALYKAAGQAIYLQAWFFVPPEQQGVTFVMSDGTEITSADLLTEIP